MPINFTKEETEWLESIGGTFTNEDDKWLCKIQGGRIRIIVEKIPCDIPYLGTIEDGITKLEFVQTDKDLKELVNRLLRMYCNSAKTISNAAIDAGKLKRKIRTKGARMSSVSSPSLTRS